MARARIIVLFTALLAFSTAVAGSNCGAEHIAPDCCLSLEPASPALAPDVAAPGATPAAAPADLPRARAGVWPIAMPVDRPPLSKPYFARSTRILS